MQNLNSSLIRSGNIEKAREVLDSMLNRINTFNIPAKIENQDIITQIQSVATGLISVDSFQKIITDPSQKLEISDAFGKAFYTSPFAEELLQQYLIEFEDNQAYKNVVLNSYFNYLNSRKEKDKLKEKVDSVLLSDKKSPMAKEWKNKLK